MCKVSQRNEYPKILRCNLQADEDEFVGVISLPRDGWLSRQAPMWFKPSLDITNSALPKRKYWHAFVSWFHNCESIDLNADMLWCSYCLQIIAHISLFIVRHHFSTTIISQTFFMPNIISIILLRAPFLFFLSEMEKYLLAGSRSLLQDTKHTLTLPEWSRSSVFFLHAREIYESPDCWSSKNFYSGLA